MSMTKAEKDKLAALGERILELETIIKESKEASEWATYRMNFKSETERLEIVANTETDRANRLAIELGESEARNQQLAAELNAHRMNGESMQVI